MNISNIKVKLTDEDLLGMIQEFLNVDGLSIDEININKTISVVGCYNKGMKIKFAANLIVKKVRDNVLSLKVENVKVCKIPIWSKLISFALKKGLKNLESMGISFENGYINLDFYLIVKYIPSVNFILKNVMVFKEYIEVEVEDLVYSDKKETVSLDELKQELNNDKDLSIDKDLFNKKEEQVLLEEVKFIKSHEYVLNKTKDDYSDIRFKVKDKIPSENDKLKEYFLLVPDCMALLYRLMRDKRLDTKTKVFIGAGISYLALPIDIIPDSIPFAGKMDDVAIVFLILDRIIDDIPENIILEHWQGNEDIIKKCKELRDISFDTIGRDKTVKVLSGAFVLSKKIIHIRKYIRKNKKEK